MYVTSSFKRNSLKDWRKLQKIHMPLLVYDTFCNLCFNFKSLIQRLQDYESHEVIETYLWMNQDVFLYCFIYALMYVACTCFVQDYSHTNFPNNSFATYFALSEIFCTTLVWVIISTTGKLVLGDDLLILLFWCGCMWFLLFIQPKHIYDRCYFCLRCFFNIT